MDVKYGGIAWTQADFLRVANVLSQQVWNEPLDLDGWDVSLVLFNGNCNDNFGGFDDFEITYDEFWPIILSLKILDVCLPFPPKCARYPYEPDQLRSARMIRNMRDMDMPLATIRRVLAVLPVSQAQAELLVRQYLDLRERQLQQIQQQARQFTQQLIPEANTMSLEVAVKDIPAQQIISITRHHKVDGLSKQIDHDIGALFSLVNDHGAHSAGAPFGIYHGPVNEQEDGPVETCLAVEGKVEARDNIEAKQLEGGQAACVTIHGEQCHFPELLAAYDAAADWIQKNGYETTQPPREVWHSPPGPDAKWEIVWLFK